MSHDFLGPASARFIQENGEDFTNRSDARDAFLLERFEEVGFGPLKKNIGVWAEFKTDEFREMLCSTIERRAANGRPGVAQAVAVQLERRR